jgi:hypothetical protein
MTQKKAAQLYELPLATLKNAHKILIMCRKNNDFTVTMQFLW